MRHVYVTPYNCDFEMSKASCRPTVERELNVVVYGRRPKATDKHRQGKASIILPFVKVYLHYMQMTPEALSTGTPGLAVPISPPGAEAPRTFSPRKAYSKTQKLTTEPHGYLADKITIILRALRKLAFGNWKELSPETTPSDGTRFFTAGSKLV